MIASNSCILLTKVVFRFWIYSFTRTLILVLLCSFLLIKSSLLTIYTFLLSPSIPQATRKPLSEANSRPIPEIDPCLKLLVILMTNRPIYIYENSIQNKRHDHLESLGNKLIQILIFNPQSLQMMSFVFD